MRVTTLGFKQSREAESEKCMNCKKMRMIVWDVKRGNAISLHLPNGRIVMVDCGSSEDCSPVMLLHSRYGVNLIHELIVTHPHADHMADLGTIHSLGMGPTVLYRPKGISEDAIKSGNTDKSVVDSYLVADKRYTAKLDPSDDIANPENTGGVRFRVFKPTAFSENDLNNRSLVVVVSYGNEKILLTGDCTPAAMRELIEKESFKAEIAGTTIMVAPHHGHESCYCPELMDELKKNPKLRICIISDGKDTDEVSAVNKYASWCSGLSFLYDGITPDFRKCLTTRKDGHIVVDVGIGVPIEIKTENLKSR